MIVLPIFAPCAIITQGACIMTQGNIDRITEQIWAVYDELATLVAVIDEVVTSENKHVIADKSDNMP